MMPNDSLLEIVGFLLYDLRQLSSFHHMLLFSFADVS